MKRIFQIISTVLFAYLLINSDSWAQIPMADPLENPWAGAREAMNNSSGPACHSAYVCNLKTKSWQTWKNMVQTLNAGSEAIVTSANPAQSSATNDPYGAQADATAGRAAASITEGLPNYFAPQWKALYSQMRVTVLALVTAVNKTESEVGQVSVRQILGAIRETVTTSQDETITNTTELATQMGQVVSRLDEAQGSYEVIRSSSEVNQLNATHRAQTQIRTVFSQLIVKAREAKTLLDNGNVNKNALLTKLTEVDTVYSQYSSALPDFITVVKNDVDQKAISLRRDEAHWIAALYLTLDGDFSGSYPEKKSSDGKVKCKAEGPETQDYEACKTMADLYDGARVAEVGVQGIQQVVTVSNQMDMQREFSERTQEGDYAAGLKLQRDTMELQRDQSIVQSGFHVAKLGTLWGAMEAMPTIESITDRCTSRITRDGKGEGERLLLFQGLFSMDPPGAPALNASQLCQEVVTSSNNKFIMNQQAIAAIRDEMIKAGFDAAKMAGMAAIYEIQKDKLDNAIDDLENFQPSEVVLDPTVLEQAKCLADPTLPGCVEGIYDRDVGFSENVFNVGGTEGMNGVNVGGTDETTGADGAVSGSASGSSVRPLGSINTLGGKESGIAGYVPGAARVKSAAKSSPGAGGGGGGGASMPSGGGAGGGGEGGAAGAGSDISKLNYGSGGTGALNYGKTTASAPKKDKAENPFNQLFNKDKPATGSGDVLEFGRNPASIGDKEGKGLFEMISGRYNAVNSRDDLLIYERKD